MKKLFRSLVAVAAAAAMTSCAKDMQEISAGTGASFHVTLQSAGTKAVFGTADGSGYPVFWQEGDEVKVLALKTPGSENVQSVTEGKKYAVAIADGGKTASFLAEVPAGATAPYQFFVLSPAGAFASCGDDAADKDYIQYTIPASQTPTATSVDPAAIVTMGVSSVTPDVPSSVSLTFNHLAAYGLLTLSNLDTGGKAIRSVTLTFDESLGVSGRWMYHPSTASSAAKSKGNIITVNTDRTENIFFACGPADISGTTLKVAVAVEGGSLTREVTIPAGKEFKAGIISRFAIDMTGITVEDGLAPFKGKGTDAEPFLIETSGDLVRLAELCNGPESAGFLNKSYRQIADIDMNQVDLQAIGSVKAKAFQGKYDGGGYTLSNLAPVPAGGAAGLFSYVDGAEISRLRIDGYTNAGKTGEQGVVAGNAVNATFSDIAVKAHVRFAQCATGGVVGFMEGGNVENCHFEGRIQNEETGTFQGVTVVSCVGGMVGYASRATIKDCSFKGDVTASGEQLGGIAGQVSESTIDNCRVLPGSTVVGDNYYVGGIAGEMLKGGVISNCEVQAHVVCWYPGAAGIVAWVQSGDILNCTVGRNALVRTGQHQAGGIVAYIYHKDTAQTVNIGNCTVLCDVAASYIVGGIVGECNPSHSDTKVNLWNCAYMGGELIDAGYAASKWTMVGGIMGWARMGNTSATLNIVNCFSDPSVIRCDFPHAAEVDMGGLIGEQGGANASVNIQGCYNTLAPGRVVINGKQDIPSQYYNYAALIGLPNTAHFDHVYYINGLPAFGKANAGTAVECRGLAIAQMTDGTLLEALNEFVTGYKGDLTLRRWTAGANGYPVLEGMDTGSAEGKKRPLRVSLIGDSLSSFDGYAPHGYQGSRAPNGYRCHYPTSDGDVTTAAQTYWYMLTYDYLKNAVWDTNLAFSGTAVTRCTDSSKSGQYWYGQDFCARYIENGGMGSPDIIIINGGANDWAHNCYNILGNQKLERYPSGTPRCPDDAAMNAVYAVADACKTLDEARALPDATFVEAYVKLVKMMTLQYPYVKIVVLIHDTLTPDVEEAMLHIARHYASHCRAVDLYQVNGFNDLGWNFEYLDKGFQPNMPKHDFDWSKKITTGDLRQNCSDHYSAVAMKFIAEKIYNEVGSWLEESAVYNENGSGSISDFENVNGNW